MNLTNSRDTAVIDREMFRDSQQAEPLDIHVVEQHRLSVVGEFGEQRDALDHSAEADQGLREGRFRRVLMNWHLDVQMLRP